MKRKDKKALTILLKIIYYILFWWLILIINLIKYINQNKCKDETPKYNSKGLLTDYEKYFFNVINEEFSNLYFIMPQVNLASIVNKVKDFPAQYQNELNRNIDIGIFDKTNMTPLLLIEINDRTHNTKSRIDRDNKVHNICKIAKINLITFYSNKPNKREYIIKRIKETLSNNLPNVSN